MGGRNWSQGWAGKLFFTGRAGKGSEFAGRGTPLSGWVRARQGQGKGGEHTAVGRPSLIGVLQELFLGHPVDYYFSQCRHCSLRCFEM